MQIGPRLICYGTLLFGVQFLNFPLLAQTVPQTLFGVELGKVYVSGSNGEGDSFNIPMKRFAGMERFLGLGVHFYFQPEIEYEAFPYLEHRESNHEEYFSTSFRLYMLPALSKEILDSSELPIKSSQWEVVMIEWSGDKIGSVNAYNWAVDMCGVFEADLGLKPKVNFGADFSYYECIFSEENREFSVRSWPTRYVRLSYSQEIVESKNSHVERIINKARASKIKPY